MFDHRPHRQVVLWLDDIRDPALYRKTTGWRLNEQIIWCHSVNEAIDIWRKIDGSEWAEVVEIDLDHDAGDYVADGGDYIKFLDWLEEHKVDFTKFAWQIHSMNPVGVQNMLAVLRRNGVEG